MDETVIRTDRLTKRFGAFGAVENVSLSVGRGEIYGFLGLNGAGKTTTIRMLLGLIRATGGSATILGSDVTPGSGPWDRVGSLVEVPSAYPELTVRENLEVTRRLRRVERPSAVEDMIEQLNLARDADRKARHLSLGNMQRLGLAKALIHGPEVLILDEPSNGLDPAGIVEIRQLLRTLAHERAVTVFVSSHVLDEVARIADRVGIIHKGQLLQEVGTSEIKSLLGKRLLIETRSNAKARSILSKHGYTSVAQERTHIIVRDESALRHPDRVASLLVRRGVPPTSLHETEESLESFFLRTTDDAEGVPAP